MLLHSYIPQKNKINDQPGSLLPSTLSYYLFSSSQNVQESLHTN